jgi:hypothetical protein
MMVLVDNRYGSLILFLIERYIIFRSNPSTMVSEKYNHLPPAPFAGKEAQAR